MVDERYLPNKYVPGEKLPGDPFVVVRVECAEVFLTNHQFATAITFFPSEADPVHKNPVTVCLPDDMIEPFISVLRKAQALIPAYMRQGGAS